VVLFLVNSFVPAGAASSFPTNYYTMYVRYWSLWEKWCCIFSRYGWFVLHQSHIMLTKAMVYIYISIKSLKCLYHVSIKISTKILSLCVYSFNLDYNYFFSSSHDIYDIEMETVFVIMFIFIFLGNVRIRGIFLFL